MGSVTLLGELSALTLTLPSGGASPCRQKKLAEHRGAPPVTCTVYFKLEGVSETEIGLNEVVGSPIDEVITSFTEDPDMRSKPIFESTAKVAEHPIVSNVVPYRIHATTGESDVSGHTGRIGHGKGLTDGVSFPTVANDNATEACEEVGCQVNSRARSHPTGAATGSHPLRHLLPHFYRHRHSHRSKSLSRQ